MVNNCRMAESDCLLIDFLRRLNLVYLMLVFIELIIILFLFHILEVCKLCVSLIAELV